MFGSALTLASFVKLIHSIFLSRLPKELKNVKEVSAVQWFPMVVLALLCVLLGVFYPWILNNLLYPALGISATAETPVLTGIWSAGTATLLLIIGIVIGVIIFAVGGLFKKNIRRVPTWTCGEIQENQQMTIPGTHFYKTVTSMKYLKPLYSGQEKNYFDLYDQSGRVGLSLTGFLRWLHSGILSTYLTWVTLGLLIILVIVCKIW